MLISAFQINRAIHFMKNNFRTVGGFMNHEKWLKEMADLDELIEKQGLKVDKSHFYTNGYDAPFKLFNRKNEVWRIKLEE